MTDVYGSGLVRILPDFSEFDAAFQSGVAAAVSQADQTIRDGLSAAAGAASIDVGFDTSDLAPSVSAAVDGAQLVLPFEADTGEITTSIDAAVDGADGTVGVEADTAGVTGAVDAAIDGADGTVQIDPDTSAVPGAVESAIDAVDATVAVTANTQPAQVGIDGLIDRIRAASSQDAEVLIRANVADAQRALSEIERQLASPGLSDQQINILLDQHGQARRSIDQLTGEMEEFTAEVNEAEDATDRLGVGLKSLVGVAAGLVAGRFVQVGVAYNTLLQTTTAALTTLLDSGEAAGDMLAEVTTFAQTSPFPRQLWIEATQTLIGFGREAEDVIPLLSGIQDAVAATGGSAQDIEEVVRVLSQVQSSNRITAETFNQLAVRGIDAATIIGTQFDMSASEIRTAVSEGAIDAGEALDALAAGMTERFGGAAEGVKDTWVGAADRIQGAIRDISASLLSGFVDPTGGGVGVELANSIADALRTFEAEQLPRIVSQLEPFYELMTAVGEVALPLVLVGMESLSPLFEATSLTLSAMVPLVEALAMTIEAIPDPLLRAAGSLIAIQKAISLLRLTSVLGAASAAVIGFARETSGLERQMAGTVATTGRFRAAMASIRNSVVSPTGAVLALGFAWSQYDSMMQDAARSGRESIGGIREGIDTTTMSVSELMSLNRTLLEQEEYLQSQRKDGWRGALIDRDFNAELDAGKQSLQEWRVENEALIESMERARWQEWADDVVTWNTAVADNLLAGAEGLASLAEAEAQGVVDALVWIRDTGDTSAASMLNLATQVDIATLSEEEMANAASALGVELESLEGFVDSIAGAIDDFVSDAVSGLPSVAGALRDANEDGKVSTREFITGLKEDAADLLVWQSQIRTIAAAGFTELAAELARIGPEQASQIADELATAAEEGNRRLLEETDLALTNRNAAFQVANDQFRGLGEQWVVETGFVASEASRVFGDNFDPATQARMQMELAQSDLSAQGQQLAIIAATEGLHAASEFGQALDLDKETYDEAIRVGLRLRTLNVDEDASVFGDRTAMAVRDTLTTTLSEGRTNMMTIGMDLVRGLNEGLEAEKEALRSVSRGLAAVVPSVISGLWQLGSPSRMAREFGTWFSEGLALGLEDGEAAVSAAANGVAESAAAALQAPVTAMSGWSPSSGSVGRSGSLGDPRTEGTSVAPVIVERIELPTSEPELAAAAIVNGMVAIETVVGSR